MWVSPAKLYHPVWYFLSMWEHNVEKFLFCFIPQGALWTKAMIHTVLSQGPSGEVPRFKTAVSLVTTKVRPLEVGMGVLWDIPEKVPELELIP